MTRTLPIVGNVAKNADFYGRRREMRRLWQTLETDHVLLLAPRRVGKSSVIARLGHDADGHGYKAISDSVAGCSDELQFVRQLYRAAVAADGSVLQRAANHPGVGFLKRFFPQDVTIGPLELTFGDGAAEHWKELGAALVRTLAAAESSRHLVMVDELPLFVLRLAEDERRARDFLEWFRDIRQKLDGVRWLVAGSIGLDGIAETLRLSSTINDFQQVFLGEYEAQEAEGFVRWASERAKLAITDDVCSYVIERVGWPIPFFLALMVRELHHAAEDGRPVDRHAVDEAFAALTSVQHRSYYSHWNERLDVHLPAGQAERARSALDLIASADEGATESAILAADVDPSAARTTRAILNLLYAEGYISRDDGGRWHFRSPLLRAYWRNFVSIAS